ncbi:MAG: DUF3348 family protein [Acidovorax sp.]|nr:DUF3348 family protein [Acidovorax sp.]
MNLHSHHRLHSSALVRLLQQWMPAAQGRGRREVDVGEELSQWLSTVDAVTLSRAVRATDDVVPTNVLEDAGAAALRELAQLVTTVRAELAVVVEGRLAAGRPQRSRADSTPTDPPDPAAEAEFAPHGVRYLAAQKQIEVRTAVVRAQVRNGVASAAPGVRPLAALDAVMEQVMAPREQRLWGTLAGHLERRMAHRRQLHEDMLAASGGVDDPARWKQPGGWLHAFERDLQALLQAEIDVRLQPVMGLLEAAQHKNKEMTE